MLERTAFAVVAQRGPGLVLVADAGANAVLSVLLDLEIAGRIETLPGNRVALLGDGPP